MKFTAIGALMLASSVAATTLTPDNWDEMTAGKTVFIKFQAPWWGHCKNMKPAWDALMEEYDGHDSILVGDVDCTAEGKSICGSVGVKGYPTIKHGDISSLEDYKGGRDTDSLKAFASTLKPSCSPANIDLCEDEDRAKIEELIELSNKELKAKISDGDAQLKEAEDHFSDEVGKLQDKYQLLSAEKDEKIAEIEGAGLKMWKAVLAHKKKSSSAKDEL